MLFGPSYWAAITSRVGLYRVCLQRRNHQRCCLARTGLQGRQAWVDWAGSAVPSQIVARLVIRQLSCTLLAVRCGKPYVFFSYLLPWNIRNIAVINMYVHMIQEQKA